jgi:uncharacterized membrane protein
VGPCPVCGKDGKIVSGSFYPTIGIQASAAFKSTHEYYEKHRKWAVFSIALTIVSSVIGIVPLGFFGVALGLILGVISFYVGPKATTKVREIRYGQST